MDGGASTALAEVSEVGSASSVNEGGGASEEFVSALSIKPKINDV